MLKKVEKKKFEKNIVIIHGPNLNLLGQREPHIYGHMTLAELNKGLRADARKSRYKLRVFQSNHEGKLIDFIHAQRKWADSIVINPGAFTHYSYAIRDALAAVDLPAYEVHLTDIHRREKFRRISVIRDVCVKQISGFGVNSYAKAIQHFLSRSRAPRSRLSRRPK